MAPGSSTKTWSPGLIVEQLKEAHSFLIEDKEQDTEETNFFKPCQVEQSDSAGVESNPILPEASNSGPATSQTTSLSSEHILQPRNLFLRRELGPQLDQEPLNIL